MAKTSGGNRDIRNIPTSKLKRMYAKEMAHLKTFGINDAAAQGAMYWLNRAFEGEMYRRNHG